LEQRTTLLEFLPVLRREYLLQQAKNITNKKHENRNLNRNILDEFSVQFEGHSFWAYWTEVEELRERRDALFWRASSE